MTPLSQPISVISSEKRRLMALGDAFRFLQDRTETYSADPIFDFTIEKLLEAAKRAERDAVAVETAQVAATLDLKGLLDGR